MKSLLSIFTLCSAIVSAEPETSNEQRATSNALEAQLALSGQISSKAEFDKFRIEHPPVLGTESSEYFFFEQFDDTPLVDRLFWFGEKTDKGYLILDPERVGGFTAPNTVTEVDDGTLALNLELKIGSRWIDRIPDRRGIFPTTFLPPTEQVEVALRFREEYDGKTVFFGLPGGGILEAKKMKIGEDGVARFTFGVTGSAGVYLLECYIGRRKTVIPFWVGRIGAHISQLTGGEHDQVPDAYFTHFKLPADLGAPVRAVPAKAQD